MAQEPVWWMAALRGVPVVLFFGYTHCPDTCPATLAKLAQALQQSGAGGNVVVWSNIATDFRGTITATGAGTGSGGAVEVSSHGVLSYDGLVDVTAASGRTGTLLLDPYDVTIQTASGSPAATCSSGTCTPTGSESILQVSTLESALASANVTVSTGSRGARVSCPNGSRPGLPTVHSPNVKWSSGTGW